MWMVSLKNMYILKNLKLTFLFFSRWNWCGAGLVSTFATKILFKESKTIPPLGGSSSYYHYSLCPATTFFLSFSLKFLKSWAIAVIIWITCRAARRNGAIFRLSLSRSDLWNQCRISPIRNISCKTSNLLMVQKLYICFGTPWSLRCVIRTLKSSDLSHIWIKPEKDPWGQTIFDHRLARGRGWYH